MAEQVIDVSVHCGLKTYKKLIDAFVLAEAYFLT